MRDCFVFFFLKKNHFGLLVFVLLNKVINMICLVVINFFIIEFVFVYICIIVVTKYFFTDVMIVFISIYLNLQQKIKYNWRKCLCFRLACIVLKILRLYFIWKKYTFFFSHNHSFYISFQVYHSFVYIYWVSN